MALTDNKIAEAYVDVKANTAKYERSLKSIRFSLGQIAGISSAAFAIRGLARFSVGAMRAAGDMVEIGSMFEVTFQGIESEANKMAESIADDFDLANSSAKELLASTGDMLFGFGATRKEALDLSNKVGKLAGDLASFKNIQGGASEAADRLRSAMLGNSRAALSLGIAFSQKNPAFKQRLKQIMDTTGASRELARAQLVLKIATEQSGNALGDYDRTQESFSNRQRKLTQQWIEFREVIGASLIDFSNASNGLNDLSEDIDSLSNKISEFQKQGFFSSWGSNVKKVFKDIGDFILFIFDGISTIISHAVSEWTSIFISLKDAFVSILSGDFKGAADALGRGMEEVTNSWKTLFSDLEGDVNQYFDNLAKNSAQNGKEIAANNKTVIEQLGDEWDKSTKNTEDGERKKQKAIEKTKQSYKGTAEGIRDAMQKAVLGSTGLAGSLNGVTVPNTITNVSTQNISPSKNTQTIVDLIMETNSILRDIKNGFGNNVVLSE